MAKRNDPRGYDATALELLARIEAAGLPPGVQPDDALFAVTCVLRQRISRAEAYHLAGALPPSVQRLLRGCNRRNAERAESVGRDELLARVATHLCIHEADAEDVTLKVIRVVHPLLPVALIEHVASQLPPDIRALWLDRDLEEPTPVGQLERAVAPDETLTRRTLEGLRMSGALPPGLDERDALATVLGVLAQRLAAGEARDPFAAVPTALRPLVAHYVLRRPERSEAFGREQLFARVARLFGLRQQQGEEVTRAVFSAIIRTLPFEEVHAVAAQLPPELKELWLEARATAASMPAAAP